MKVVGYRDLIVWQKAMDLAERVYWISSRFPKEEVYGLSSQIRRVAVSTPSNIAEGQGRESGSDFARFLSIANGSLREIETQLHLTTRLKFITQEEIEPLIELCEKVAKLFNGLRKSIIRRQNER